MGDMRFFNRYAYAANNPYKFTDPDGRFFTPETVWDAANVVVGAVSAYNNFSDGRIGAGLIDVGGVAVDVAATIIPAVPGGAGATIKAVRGAEAVADAARAARPADGVSMGTDEALDTAVSYLGDGYKRIDSGVYRSADGTRQVRMIDRDLNHPRQEPHMNFEEGRTVPNHRGTSTFEAENNSHVYLPEE
jgi:hypothetical protein